MAKCALCGTTSEEAALSRGITPEGMIVVCERCAKRDGIPVLKRATESQIKKSDERFTVRERMERMSGSRDRTQISEDQMATQRNIARLKMPLPKQHNEYVEDNYYWTLGIARKRAKITVSELAKRMQVAPEVIQEIEKGRLPANFEELFEKLEVYLRIRLLKKDRPKKVGLKKSPEEEQEILRNVEMKMGGKMKVCEEAMIGFKDTSVINANRGNSSKKNNADMITSKDLADRKKTKDTQKKESIKHTEEDSMIEEDVDLDDL